MMTTLARCWVTQDVRRLPWPSPVGASMTARALYCALCLLPACLPPEVKVHPSPAQGPGAAGSEYLQW